MADAYKKIQLRVSMYEWNQFRKLKEEDGLSARQVLEISGCPCEKCRGTNVVAFNKINGEQIFIPKGILTKRNK